MGTTSYSGSPATTCSPAAPGRTCSGAAAVPTGSCCGTARETWRPAAGQRQVLADGADVVLGDCEAMRVLPPEPQSPPPRPVVPGVYGGRTTQGELVTFQVDSGGALSGLVFPVIRLECAPAGSPPVVWAQDFGAAVYVVGRDGTFTSRAIGSPGRSRGSSHVPNRRLRALDGGDRDGLGAARRGARGRGDDLHLHDRRRQVDGRRRGAYRSLAGRLAAGRSTRSRPYANRVCRFTRAGISHAWIETKRGGWTMPTWLLVLIIVLVVLALFGGVGYGRR